MGFVVTVSCMQITYYPFISIPRRLPSSPASPPSSCLQSFLLSLCPHSQIPYMRKRKCDHCYIFLRGWTVCLYVPAHVCASVHVCSFFIHSFTSGHWSDFLALLLCVWYLSEHGMLMKWLLNDSFLPKITAPNVGSAFWKVILISMWINWFLLPPTIYKDSFFTYLTRISIFHSIGVATLTRVRFAFPWWLSILSTFFIYLLCVLFSFKEIYSSVSYLLDYLLYWLFGSLYVQDISLLLK